MKVTNLSESGNTHSVKVMLVTSSLLEEAKRLEVTPKSTAKREPTPGTCFLGSCFCFIGRSDDLSTKRRRSEVMSFQSSKSGAGF
ncbi:hypothetical protein PRIPAC_87498 [Pristionchus pacificus]|uniref:Uncharacterized protein n=1 Tax=Pristionchus pacificus TaxID=54126 RepID=A0A2A6CWH1_PRIPA|nr:hypothetical protein PRIPAC_87498 [Pristionchus pacificus]|eukprot:PDM82572.1 hypothetical protein PRIPAC_36965 [Pristionchus pacificus]